MNPGRKEIEKLVIEVMDDLTEITKDFKNAKKKTKPSEQALESNLRMKHAEFLKKVKHLAALYSDGFMDIYYLGCVISLFTRLDVRDQNIAIECLCIILKIALPKMFFDWSQPNKEKLFKLIKEVQEDIMESERHSMEVQFTLTDILKCIKFRFDIKDDIKDICEGKITVQELKKLNKMLEQIAISKDE